LALNQISCYQVTILGTTSELLLGPYRSNKFGPNPLSQAKELVKRPTLYSTDVCAQHTRALPGF